MSRTIPLLSLLCLLLACLFSCDRNNNLNLIDAQQDIALGKQLTEEISRSPEQFPLLKPQQYPESYQYLQNMVNTILSSGEVVYRDEFPWQVYIIHDDEVLNAFATPGGYIYVYTGLIKYLDHESDLAGVLGHEIAHADLRHGSRQMQKAYGLNLLLNMFIDGGDRNMASEIVAQLAGQLAGLKFSREYEEEADARSVDYLSQTPYPCNAAGVFFQKLQAEEQGGNIPSFLSTHPHPKNRIKKINQRSKNKGCYQQSMPPSSYDAFKNSLP
jgi:predicted Zn-dependent protease